MALEGGYLAQAAQQQAIVLEKLNTLQERARELQELLGEDADEGVTKLAKLNISEGVTKTVKWVDGQEWFTLETFESVDGRLVEKE